MSIYNSLSNKVVLVTGGSKGIGLSIANFFLKNKAKVFVTGTKKYSEKFKGLEYIQCDFLNTDEFDSFLSIINKLKIDILINNAGINKIGQFDKINSDDFMNIHKVNTFSPFKICQSVLPNMQTNKWGRIINIASIFGKISKEYRASYSASKFGLDGITASLAAEVAKDGILVNTVSPGFIKTELTKNILGIKGMKLMSSKVPIQRLGEPEEVARLVLWLCSDQNSYISGQNIVIDGGFIRV